MSALCVHSAVSLSSRRESSGRRERARPNPRMSGNRATFRTLLRQLSGSSVTLIKGSCYLFFVFGGERDTQDHRARLDEDTKRRRISWRSFGICFFSGVLGISWWREIAVWSESYSLFFCRLFIIFFFLFFSFHSYAHLDSNSLCCNAWKRTPTNFINNTNP